MLSHLNRIYRYVAAFSFSFLIISCGSSGGGGGLGSSEEEKEQETGSNAVAREPGKWLSSGDMVSITFDSISSKRDLSGNNLSLNFEGMFRQIHLNITTPDNALLIVNGLPQKCTYSYEQTGNSFTCNIQVNLFTQKEESLVVRIAQGHVPSSSSMSVEAGFWEYTSGDIHVTGGKAVLTKEAR